VLKLASAFLSAVSCAVAAALAFWASFSRALSEAFDSLSWSTRVLSWSLAAAVYC